MDSREVSLIQVLEFREKKAAIQKELGQHEDGGTVISLGLNIPGPVKSSPLLSEAFQEGRNSLERMIGQHKGTVVQKAVLEEMAGYAAIYLVRGADRLLWKKEAVRLEENHALGRLFDLDVLGENQIPIPRETIGARKRICLLCGKEAKVCGRNRTHSIEELQNKVREILIQWKEGAE